MAAYPAAAPVDASVPNGFLPTGAINVQNAVNSLLNNSSEGNLMTQGHVNSGDLLVYPRCFLGDDRSVSFARSPIDFSQERQPGAGKKLVVSVDWLTSLF